jgi:hypothetical protein
MHRRSVFRIFAIIGASLLLLWALSYPIMGRIAQSQVKRFSHQITGQELRYSRVERAGNHFVFHDPLFYTHESVEGSVRASAESLGVTLHVNPFRLLFQVDLAIAQPTLQIASTGSIPPSIPWSLPKSSSLFSPKVVWELSDGAFELISPHQSHSLLFQAQGVQRGKRYSEIWCSTDQLQGYLFKKRGEKRLDLTLEECDVASLLQQIGSLFPRLLGEWEIANGQMDGAMHLLLSQGRLVECAGEMQLSNWAVNHPALSSWRVEIDRGAILFQEHRLTGEIDAALTSSDKHSPLKLQGELLLHPSLELGLELTWLSETLAQSRLFLSKDDSRIDFELIRNGADQLRLFQGLAAQWLPSLLQFQLVDGVVSARGAIAWQDRYLKEIEVKQLTLENFAFTTEDRSSSGAVGSAAGAFFVATLPSCDLFKNLEGWLELSEASLILEGKTHLEGLNGRVQASGGSIEQLSLSGTYRGLHLKCHLDPLTTRSQLILSVSALGSDLSPWLPDSHRDPFLLHFGKDQLAIEASLAPGLDALHLEGSCAVEGPRCEQLSIAIDFEPVYSRTFTPKVPAKGWISSLLLELVDCRPNPNALWERGRCTGLKLRQGEVHGVDLPLDRYAPVLVLLDPDYQVTGLAEMRGHFDASSLSVIYEARDVSFETSLFRIEVGRIGDLAKAERVPEESPIHHVSFARGEQGGTIPISGARCWINAGDLSFQEVTGIVTLDGPNVSVADICADAEGMHFEGSLDLDRTQPWGSRLQLSSPTAYGPASAAQRVCGHYSQMALWDLPLKGWIETRDEGLQLLFHFYPDYSDLELTATGWLRHGGWSSPDERLTVSDLDLAFDYDHTPQLLRLAAADGDLIQQINDEILHYSLVTHEAVISDLDRGYGHFDLELYQDGVQMARLAGSAMATYPDEPHGTMELFLDPTISYLGHLSPKLHRCTMIDWLTPLEVSGSLSCDLETLDLDAALIHLFSIPFPTPHQIQAIAGDKCRGIATGHFQLHDGSQWKLALVGDDVTLRDHTIHRLETRVGSLNGRWTIEELRADNLFLSASLAQAEDGWQVEQLTAEWEDLGRFDLAKPVAWKWSKAEGLVLEEGAGYLNGEIPLGWKRVVYNSSGGVIDALAFSATPRLVRELVERWSGKSEWLNSLAPAGQVAGSALIRWGGEGPLRLELDLADDDYFIGDRWWTLTGCHLAIDPNVLAFSAQTSLFGLPYWVNLTTTPTAPNRGRCSVSQWQELDRPHLSIDWVYNGGMIRLQKVVGSIQGLHFHLNGVSSSHEEDIALRGEIGINGRSPLLPPFVTQTLGRIGVGGGYWLNGLFRIPRKRWQDFSFQGELTGSEIELAGLRLQELSSYLTCSSSEIELTAFQIRDAAGSASFNRMTLKCDSSGEWIFSLPSAQMTNIAFERLRTEKELPKRLRSMAIPKAEVRQFCGVLSDKQSWIGRGSLRFETPSGQTGGLIASALTPAMGTIRYRLADGRLLLTDFKDVYSHDKKARFLLANRRDRAYVDLDGSLNIPLRVKQNRLLMKFAEMFLISVHGTVSKPEVSLCDPSPRSWRRGASAEPDAVYR